MDPVSPVQEQPANAKQCNFWGCKDGGKEVTQTELLDFCDDCISRAPGLVLWAEFREAMIRHGISYVPKVAAHMTSSQAQTIAEEKAAAEKKTVVEDDVPSYTTHGLYRPEPYRSHDQILAWHVVGMCTLDRCHKPGYKELRGAELGQHLKDVHGINLAYRLGGPSIVT